MSTLGTSGQRDVPVVHGDREPHVDASKRKELLSNKACDVNCKIIFP